MAEETPVNPTTSRGADRERVHAAQQMLTAFFVLAKTARMYEANNDSYRSTLSRFCELLGAYMGEHFGCTIRLFDDLLFVDDQFVPIDSDDRIGVRSVLDRWKELGVGGLVFGDAFTPEDISVFVRLLWTFSAGSGNPLEQMNRTLIEGGIESVSLLDRTKLPQGQEIDIEDRQRLRRQARDTFFRAVMTVRDMMLATDRGQQISVTRTRRVIHAIIDQISQDESALMELASIKDFDEYTYAHSVNVSIYALALGFRIGLSRLDLSELGFAALFHDIGKVKLPRDLVTKPDRFDEFDWSQMRLHPALGAMTVAGSLKIDSHMARALVAAFEHQINPDGSGYPPLPDTRPINLYSRIIAVADNFDALTSGRVYIKSAIPPVEVLRKMMYQMGNKFDAFLLKLFVSLIGVYPIGSLVLLSEGSIGIVTKVNQAEMSRPEVRIIADKNGPKFPTVWIDLADPANRSVEIARILDPERYGIEVTRYILTD